MALQIPLMMQHMEGHNFFQMDFWIILVDHYVVGSVSQSYDPFVHRLNFDQ